MTFTKKLEILQNDIEETLSLLVDKFIQKGYPIIIEDIDEDLCFNMDFPRWLRQITSNKLIDNCGYEYNYSALSLEQLARLVDRLKIYYKESLNK
jgi:hypothetical protein